MVLSIFHMQQYLDEIYRQIKQIPLSGKVASYIPELQHVDASKFGMHISDVQGNQWHIGDHLDLFSIQSISKAMTAALVFSMIDEALWHRVGKEPSGSSFNSLVQLEYEKGIPRNPLINAGAIVMADLLIDLLDDPVPDYLNFVRKLANNDSIEYDLNVFESEKKTGFINIALANFMKNFGNIHNNVDDVLDLYFKTCSIRMSCKQLADAFLLFTNHGFLKKTEEQILTVSQTKRLNALMQTCGFYDEAGDFTYKVGLPGKSGVGGGIVAILPNKYSVAVWSPILNVKAAFC